MSAGYPGSYDWILETSGVDSRTPIDVGCGTGKASSILRRRFTVIGVEPDPMMAQIIPGVQRLRYLFR